MKRNWEYKKLTDVCSIQYGYPFESSNFTNEAKGMPLIRIRDVKDGRTETYYDGPYPAEYIVHKGEYLVGMDGEFNIAPWKSDDALLNQRVCKITAKDGVSKGYLYRFLLKELKRIEDETPFVTVKHLSAKRLNQVKLPVPPLSEQSRIVAELDLLTGIIDKQNAQLKELDNLAQAIFYDMFGDPIENNKNFEVQPLHVLCSSICGGGTPSKSNPTYWDGGDIPWVTSKDMKTSFIGGSQVHITKDGSDNSSAKLLPVNSILMVLRSGILKHTLPVAITTRRVTINQDLKAFILKQNVIEPLFFLYQMKAYSKFLLGMVRAVTADNIEFSNVKNLKMLVPPLTLQQSFAEKIQSIEKQKETIRASIADTQKLLDYTMDKYFG